MARADGDPGDVLPGAFPPLCSPPSQLRLLWQAHGKHLAVEKEVRGQGDRIVSVIAWL